MDPDRQPPPGFPDIPSHLSSPSNLASILAVHSRSTPRALALLHPDRRFDYEALDRTVDALALRLRRMGVQPGHRLALTFDDEGLLVLMILAIARLGAVSLSIARAATVAQRIEWLDLARTDHCFVQAGIPVHGVTGTHSLDWAWVDEAVDDFAPVEAFEPGHDAMHPDSPLMIVTGSGSTGRPKLIPVTHGQMRFRAESINAFFRISPQDRIATMAHMELASGVHRLFSAIFAGAAFVVQRRNSTFPDAIRAWQELTVLTTTVVHLEKILAHLPKGLPRPLDSVQLVVSSSTVSDRLRQAVYERLSRKLWVAYGINETWMVTAAGPEDSRRLAGTVGRPLPGVEMEIVDPRMRPVAPGEIGLIRVRSPGTVTGYLGDASSTGKAFRDGWFLPNDLGRLMPDGQLVFCGRADDMMICNGINISPVEIEQCLLSHPAVTDAVAMPYRHPVHQDIPVAAVSIDAEHCVTETELLDFARSRLGVHSPARIFILPGIPRDHQGKPVRAQIRQLVTEEAGRRR